MANYNMPGQPLRLHEFDFMAFTKELHDKGIKFTTGNKVGEVSVEGTPRFIGISEGQREVIESEARFKVLAAGRRFGKCQDIDSTIQLSDGSIHRIGDLIGQDVEINAMDDDYNYVRAKASVHYNAKVSVYKIITKYGSELIRTENHPLYTSLGWGSIETGELKLGTRIAFPTNNPNVGTDTFSDKSEVYDIFDYIDSKKSKLPSKYYSLDRSSLRMLFAVLIDSNDEIISRNTNILKELKLLSPRAGIVTQITGRGLKVVTKFNRLNSIDSPKDLVNSDLYWDEIVSIEYIGERHTAHLEVPEYYNYVNEAIEHNTATCVLLALAALLQPDRLIIIVGPEHAHVEKIFKELYSILVRQLKLATKGDGVSIIRNTKGDYVIQLPNGSRVEGKSGTNPDSLAGDAVDLYIFDEAAVEEKLEHLWGIARPALADKRGSAIFISSPRGRNDFYRLHKLGQKGIGQLEGFIPINDDGKGNTDDMTDWASWTFPSHSNPFIPAEEYHIAKREALEKGKYEQFKQEWDADFDAVTDVAFPEFRAFKKVEDEVGNIIREPYHVQHYNFDNANGPWFAACDFNIARPASTVYLQIDKNNNIIIFDELFKSQTDAKLQAQYILEKQTQLGVPYTSVIGDVSGSFSRAGVNEFTLMEGVLGHAPYAQRQSRDSGNHLLHQFLAVPDLDKNGRLVYDDLGQHKTFPKLFIASNCVETIHAFEAAKRKMSKDGSIKDDYKEFKTGHEGLLDAIRYALVAIFKERQGMKVIRGI